MSKGKKSLLAGGWLFFVSLIGLTLEGQDNMVRINEFMTLNAGTIQDEDGDYSDWIELYNAGTQAVDLTGWSLTDDPFDRTKWLIPQIVINANEFLLIFASGKDLRNTASELHTNFKLRGSGEYLALFNQGGDTLTAFDPFPEQMVDISYGYMDGTYLPFTEPTPGKENTQVGAILPPPEFSVNHGIFESAFELAITSGIEGAEIFYSLDGSTPSPGTGLPYSSPIFVDSTTIIRAVTVLDDTLYSDVNTRTYLFLDDVIRQPNNPEGYPAEWGPYTAITGTAIADYEMDPELMADPVYAASVKEGLASIPTMSVVTDTGYLFSHSEDSLTGGIYIHTGTPLGGSEYGIGRGWERPASLEFFDVSGTESLQVNCGLRLNGGHSRRPEKSPKHSFRFAFRSEYGPTKLNYPLFKDFYAATTFNSFVLRAGFCLSWVHHDHYQRTQAQYQRDIWSKDTQLDMGHPSSHSEYVHLYLNGIYWGIYALHERMDDDFAATYLGGDPGDYDVIKDQDLLDGEWAAWEKLFEMANAGLESNEAYQEIQGRNPDGTRNPDMEPMVDVMNLTDYMLINLYGSNTDWDHHNWAVVRNRVKPGSGFKFICWDAEHLLKSVDANILNENNNYCPSRIFQQLRKNESYRQLFADRVQQLFYNNGPLTPAAGLTRWNERSVQVEKAVPAEAARWGDYRRDVHPYQTSGPFDLYNYDNHYLPQRNFMINTYFPQRTDAFLDHLRAAGLFPELDAPEFFIEGQPYPGRPVEPGDELSMTSDQGVIYYTTIGVDPADWNFLESGSGVELVREDALKHVKVPKEDIGSGWISDPDYDVSSWEASSGEPGGIGYENGSGYEDLISLDVSEDMNDSGTDPNNSCYIRIPFTIESGVLDKMNSLNLNIRYDDGFVAYLNGTLVAKNNAPDQPVWNSLATDGHEASDPEVFDISDHLGLLSEGENLLAIQALNLKTSSSDFLFMAGMNASEESGSEISEEAVMYDGPIILDQSGHIMARTYLNGNWSAMMSSFISFPDDYMDIKLTEIHYNPLGEDSISGSDFEFVELKNTGKSTLDLEGMSFDDGLEYTFPPGSELRPGGFIVLASDEMQFYERYGFFPDGEFKGNLNNAGEQIRLRGPDGETLILMLYADVVPWPLQADGSGNSLVPTLPDPIGDPNDPRNWRASYRIGGSPGRDDGDVTHVEVPLPKTSLSSLGQNYPNPFRELTYINYVLGENARVELIVYNLMGQKVAELVSGDQPAGSHVISWDGRDESGNFFKDGIYIYRMNIRSQYENRTFTRKMIRLK